MTNIIVRLQGTILKNEGCKIRYYDSSSVIIMNTWDEIGENWSYCVSDGKGGRYIPNTWGRGVYSARS